MNDPSIDNPRLLTAAGEEDHIARELDGAATVPNEASNAAVAVGSAMARAVIAAELYRSTGELPGFAAPDRKDS